MNDQEFEEVEKIADEFNWDPIPMAKEIHKLRNSQS